MRYSNCLIYIMLIVFASCANRVSPTGGKTDVIPPKLLSADPPNFSTNMNQHHVFLRFDEYINLKDQAQQVIVSPLIEPMPELAIRKKTLELKLPDSLKSNTTYTINFGTAIVDVHEGNVFPFQYVFSTGSILDSLFITGKAIDALTQTGKKDVKILLYSGDDDSLPFKKKPDYFALTDDAGLFRITNVSPGTFYIVASDDKNSNYINDNAKEEAISIRKKITLPDSVPLSLSYFNEESKEVFVKNTTTSNPGRWDIILNKSVVQPSIVSNNPKLIAEWNATTDTLIVWNKDTVSDTLSIIIFQSGIAVDTANIKLKSKIVQGRGGTSAIVAKNSFIESSPSSLLPGHDAVFRMINPISVIDSTRMILTEDSARRNFTFAFTDSLKRELHIKYKWKEGAAYHFKIFPGALIDYAGRNNDTLDYAVTIRRTNETGSIAFTISGIESGNWILQLVTKEFAVVREVEMDSKGRHVFSNLDPQQLKARLIRDENKNGKWDTGDYFQKREAEKVYYYNGDLQSRANWDVEIEWIINSE